MTNIPENGNPADRIRTNAVAAVNQLWNIAAADSAALGALEFSTAEGQLPSLFQVGPIAAATIGAQALAAAEIWRIRTGQTQRVRVDARRALAIFRGEQYLSIDGKAVDDAISPLRGYYETCDKRWIQLHTNFPHHRDGVLRVLQCEDNRGAVATAIAQWNAAELDARLAHEGLCAAQVRTTDEWNALPQAAAIAQLPLFEIIQIGDAPPERIGGEAAASQPLSGVRVLDLSRVIAAPVGARALAQHGADVLAISAAHLPNILPLIIDTGRGKRSAQLDLRDAAERTKLLDLVRGADVFLQAYRPDSLAARGFSAEELCRARPGLVYVTLSAYSHVGPWAGRRGFDSLVQSGSGIAFEEGQAAGLDHPGKLPCQALDHATGYLAAFGAMVALQHRAQQGGSWLVRVSLAQTARWLRSFGQEKSGLLARDLSPAEVEPWLETIASPFGTVRAVAPVEQMSRTPPRFNLPPVPLGTHRAEWMRR